MNTRRLYRCRHDRWLAGVAGGMAEYFEIDPTIVRVLWILSAFFGGVTILVYIILAFVMPPEPMPLASPAGYPGAPGSAAPGATGTSSGAATADTTATGDATAADDPTATGGIPGWTPPPGPGSSPGWQAGGWSGHRHETAPGQGAGRAGFGLGVLLVVFGSIALLGAVIPTWTAIGLGPAFILALGVALIVLAARRPASES
jgi:phage shock protein PspC (stress-responsive transcriptional regulator)